MIKEYQVTLFDTENHYKPISCIVKYEQDNDEDLSKNLQIRKLISRKGVEKICAKHYWSGKDLIKYHYTRVRIRLYDKDKIARENKERYEAIKEAHYADGSWKRPKNKSTQSNN